jgi:hypothetical protein
VVTEPDFQTVSIQVDNTPQGVQLHSLFQTTAFVDNMPYGLQLRSIFRLQSQTDVAAIFKNEENIQPRLGKIRIQTAPVIVAGDSCKARAAARAARLGESCRRCP